MSITKKVIGYTPDKEAVTSYLLERKGVQVELLNYGAVIRSIRVPDRNGIVKDVVLGFDNLEDYFVNVPSFGAAIGRIVGPVPDLRLQVGDDVVMLEPSNEEGVHIHGGKKGFSHALWQAREKESVNGAAVQMNYVSPEGEDGYPGMICAGISYELDDEGNLKVIYTGESDRATPFNPTNHSYFNLAGHDSGTIKNHIVQLRHTCVMVNGEPMPPQNTLFDLRYPKRLGEALDSGEPQMAGGYDNFHGMEGEGIREILYAREPECGRSLQISSDAKGAIFYTGNYLFDYPGKEGAIYGKSAGFACEPCFVEAKKPFNPSHVRLLKPDCPFISTTIYSFGNSEKKGMLKRWN